MVLCGLPIDIKVIPQSLSKVMRECEHSGVLCSPVLFEYNVQHRKTIALTSSAAQWTLESRCDKNKDCCHHRVTCSPHRANVRSVSSNVSQWSTESTESAAACMAALHSLKINSNLSMTAARRIWTTAWSDFTVFCGWEVNQSVTWFLFYWILENN